MLVMVFTFWLYLLRKVCRKRELIQLLADKPRIIKELTDVST